MLVGQSGTDEAATAEAQLSVSVLALSGAGTPHAFSVSQRRARHLPDADDPDAVALILHTSGTTSHPKVVPLRQRNLVASIDQIGARYALGPDDVSHCVMPLFHVHGLLASALDPLAAGGTVLLPRRFSASAF